MSEEKLDRRLTPARDDLAAAQLRGVVAAPRYVDGAARVVVAASAPLRRRPSSEAPQDTEALYGESVVAYDDAEGWAWVQLERDGYVGYLPSGDLGAPFKATHRVAVLRTHGYPGASIKAPPLRAISFGAVVNITRFEGAFAVAHDGAHYWSRHLAPVETVEQDFVAVARRFLGAPYLWGGRTSEGLDCSGLVQTVLRACGVAAPRDSDIMEASLGAPVQPGAPLRRGDLLFWRGHVGIIADDDRLLHANGFHMLVVEESFSEACRRIEAQGGGAVISARRLAADVV